ncbi:uracil-DNA glycosylase [Pseudoalteromonas denitrificans]|uniref:Uracil-DNA glycosylase n=1 Tax=Pseudoalteromonas denitrificans DSM 6059 TaxID=1123010 RepID=A0A1I1IM44_9GAMM|nr:uracil-DNA glycosylase [Pseudoalteromonas denitrificans]SFC37379.1 Uracil-DNA glycosylase [Pseudoalteromonas denitrificans DSM 6059]
MNSWTDLINTEKQKDYLKKTLEYVNQRRAEGIEVYPPQNDIFNALNVTLLDDVKVVILGQDPYHGEGQAHGLCFSVLPDTKIPPSLVNMYKELATDIDNFNIPKHGYLQSWADQGVLLLNTVLTVEKGLAHSHKHLGWEQFTDKIISTLNQQKSDLIFLLWGAHAHKKGKNIDESKHHVLKATHPSPLSAYRGFFGCKHFSMTNELLVKKGKKEINWQV